MSPVTTSGAIMAATTARPGGYPYSTEKMDKHLFNAVSPTGVSVKIRVIEQGNHRLGLRRPNTHLSDRCVEPLPVLKTTSVVYVCVCVNKIICRSFKTLAYTVCLDVFFFDVPGRCARWHLNFLRIISRPLQPNGP